MFFMRYVLRNLIIIALAILLFASALSFVCMVSGCMVIWSDDVFVATMFKVVDANDLDLISEPNYLQIGSGLSRTKNDKIKVATPYMIGETTN